MNEQQFLDWCKEEVVKYTNSHLDKSDKKQITKDYVFMVWCCKTLQNNKALLSTTLFDGMYYECTYNGDKQEMYFDAYKKWENKCIRVWYNMKSILVRKIKDEFGVSKISGEKLERINFYKLCGYYKQLSRGEVIK